jgi:hypothetical protein
MKHSSFLAATALLGALPGTVSHHHGLWADFRQRINNGHSVGGNEDPVRFHTIDPRQESDVPYGWGGPPLTTTETPPSSTTSDGE